jgi:hypothetical protein
MNEISINSKSEGAKLSITTLYQMHDEEWYWLRIRGSNSRGEFLCMTCTVLAKLQKMKYVCGLSSRLFQSDDAKIS